jgi:hypothetical protein
MESFATLSSALAQRVIRTASSFAVVRIQCTEGAYATIRAVRQ